MRAAGVRTVRLTLTQPGGALVPAVNFFAGNGTGRDRVPVTGKNVDGDRRADALAGTGAGPQIKVVI